VASPSPTARVPVAGDCLTDTTTTLVPFDRGQYRMRVVDCTTSHLLEVALVGRFAGAISPSEPPPLDGPQRRAAYGTCEAQARQFLGADWQNGRLFLYVYVPVDDEWAAGARYFACTIAEDQLDFGPAIHRTGTLQHALAGAAPLTIACITIDGEVDTDGFYQPLKLTYISCDRPHNGEFVGSSPAPDTINPDDDAQQAKLISPACWRLLARYMGLSLAKLAQRRDLAVFASGIFHDAWKQGDHRARCYVETAVKHQLNRSLHA
jgi:Septum formation